jgi:hypothetical protein
MELLATNHNMNSKVGVEEIIEGGWMETELRSYLKNTIKPLIPANVKARINSVTKYSNIYQNGSIINNVASTEDVWIPSGAEIFGLGTNKNETQGVDYTNVFTDKTKRKKNKVESSDAAWWWTRTVNGKTYISGVSTGGNASQNNPSGLNAICLGFCLGLAQETTD